MLYGNYCYIIIENFPQKFSPCSKAKNVEIQCRGYNKENSRFDWECWDEFLYRVKYCNMLCFWCREWCFPGASPITTSRDSPKLSRSQQDFLAHYISIVYTDVIQNLFSTQWSVLFRMLFMASGCPPFM